MSRKTIPVSEVKDYVNKCLRDSIDGYVQGREAIALTLEHILMDTGNYKGFTHLPGVFTYDDVTLTATLVGDETRRQYH